jgi:hypothetical protein
MYNVLTCIPRRTETSLPRGVAGSPVGWREFDLARGQFHGRTSPDYILEWIEHSRSLRTMLNGLFGWLFSLTYRSISAFLQFALGIHSLTSLTITRWAGEDLAIGGFDVDP